MTIQEWLESISLLEVVIIIFVFVLIISQVLKLWKPLKNLVDFVDTMQGLPAFMEATDRKFLVLFEHLNIDPGEADKPKDSDNVS